MAQQTAVRWLLENIQKVNKMDWDILFIAAQQMEKEQIQKAFSDGQEIPINHPTLPYYSREEYYNDTYSKRQDSPDTDDTK